MHRTPSNTESLNIGNQLPDVAIAITDYALAKRARLLAAGWPADRMALVTCRQPGGVGHVVLYVDTDDGAFILDNTQERPVSPMMLDYEWEAMLCGGEWRELRGWS